MYRIIYPYGPLVGIRHAQIALLFAALAVGYGMRINLCVSIVAMTDSNINPDFPSYNWSVSVKSTMLSSFFWGYILPQVGAGQLAEKYGPKWFLGGTMFISSVFTLLIPLMSTFGAWGVMFCRTMQGFGQGFLFPCIQFCLSKWVPQSERSRMAAFVYAGGPLGTVIAMPVTGWLSASSFGWPSAFYLYGAVGVIWVALWTWQGSNDPSEHRSMSHGERKYIQQSTGDSSTMKKYPTPWRHVLTSLPVWALIIAYSGQHWGYWTLMTEIPTYMRGVLNYNIAQNGLLSATPYLTLWLLSFFFSYMSDFFINKRILSATATRKLASGIGLLGPAIALSVLGLFDQPQRGEAIALLTLAVGINAAIFSGHQVNHIDISPRFAATLMGITSSIGNIFSLIAPLIVQYIVTDETDPSQWRIVFYIAAAIYLGSDLFYTAFGKAEVQYWDKLEELQQTGGENLKRELKMAAVNEGNNNEKICTENFPNQSSPSVVISLSMEFEGYSEKL